MYIIYIIAEPLHPKTCLYLNYISATASVALIEEILLPYKPCLC